jgi:Flp pilus assembly protein TadG
MIGPRFLKAARAQTRRALRDRTGATAIEFALVAPVFISLALATIQSAVIWFAKTELQLATETASRLVFTGQTANAYASLSNFKTALCPNLPAVIQCNDVMINLTPQASISAVSTAPPTLTYNPDGSVSNNFNYNPGASSQIMVLQVMYQLPVVAGPFFDFSTQSNGKLLLVSTVVFQNEPL